jgi:type IV pilus biogenesis protein CpaD/CtpE
VKAVLAAALLAGCASVPAEEVPPAGDGVCNAAPVQHLVGQARSEAIGAEALRRSGAKTLRWIGPDTAYTQDLRQDRLNIEVRRNGIIAGIRCF